MNDAPWRAAVSTSRRRSPKSPMPQLRPERSAYSWIVQPHQRSPSSSAGGAQQRRGATTTRHCAAGAPSIVELPVAGGQRRRQRDRRSRRRAVDRAAVAGAGRLFGRELPAAAVRRAAPRDAHRLAVLRDVHRRQAGWRWPRLAQAHAVSAWSSTAARLPCPRPRSCGTAGPRRCSAWRARSRSTLEAHAVIPARRGSRRTRGVP